MKLLELVMEHLLFHWEDIVEVLIDEVIEGEVQERNRIEREMQRGEEQEEDEDEDEDSSFNQY